MPKLPHLPRRPPPPGEAERLSRWFRERDLKQQLRKENPEYAEPMRPPPVAERPQMRKLASLGLVAPFDEDVRVGQIRILHGGMFGEMRRPIHIAILSEWPPGDDDSDNEDIQTAGRTFENPRNIVPVAMRRLGSIEATPGTIEEKSYLVAPFGDYQEPATTTEWLTGRDVGALRVLCLWNTRDYPVRWLKLSWTVGEMTAQELADARDVFRHALTGVPLSDRLRAQVGAPIIHPRDPRLDYQAEETKFFSIVPEYAEYRWQLEQNQIVFASEELALAAGSRRDKPLMFAKFEIGGTKLFLRLLVQSDGRHAGISVLDASGEVSYELDGSLFALRQGTSARIEKGEALCERTLIPLYPSFIKPDGSPFDLKRVQ